LSATAIGLVEVTVIVALCPLTSVAGLNTIEVIVGVTAVLVKFAVTVAGPVIVKFPPFMLQPELQLNEEN
jgi:hypothetical protein